MLASASGPPAPKDGSPGSPFRYQSREPEKTLLHRIVRENLATLLAEAADRYPSGDLLAFISQEFARYLRCGILRHGFSDPADRAANALADHWPRPDPATFGGSISGGRQPPPK